MERKRRQGREGGEGGGKGNFDKQTNFEVNRTQIGYFISKKKPPKITKMVISQNPILPKCHSPKSLLHLHFSMNLSETCRIDVNMDFTNTNCSRFLAPPIPPSPFSLPFPLLLALSLSPTPRPSPPLPPTDLLENEANLHSHLYLEVWSHIMDRA